jgi:hypothetical protein
MFLGVMVTVIDVSFSLADVEMERVMSALTER